MPSTKSRISKSVIFAELTSISTFTALQPPAHAFHENTDILPKDSPMTRSHTTLQPTVMQDSNSRKVGQYSVIKFIQKSLLVIPNMSRILY